jgi:hypothetical protein
MRDAPRRQSSAPSGSPSGARSGFPGSGPGPDAGKGQGGHGALPLVAPGSCLRAPSEARSRTGTDSDMLDSKERKALVWSAFVAGCMLLAPAEFVSATLMLVVWVVLYRWDVAMERRENAAKAPPKIAAAE